MSVDARSARKLHNLPRHLNAFVGRETELAAIAANLDDPSCRLLTLLGTGGCGKTRLALEAAAQRVAHYSDGVWLVMLEALDQPTLITGAIADALGWQLQGVDDPWVELAEQLQDRTLLLVLDNFEQLLTGAPLLADLLAICPGLQLLVTSREVLSLTEEWVLPVGGLPLPAGDSQSDVQASSAGQLFVQRAQRIRPGFVLSREDSAAVRRIALLIGGLPLGLELAATWVKLLSPVQIAAEIEKSLDFLNTTLRNVPERQRSMRGVFEYSWNLLTAEEQRVFRQLAVFRGGFTLAAGQAVVAAQLGVLAALVDKSLMWLVPGGRYDRHLLLWQFANEKLAENPAEQAQVRATHAAYFAEFMASRLEALQGAEPHKAAEEIEADLENVRTAWQWGVAQDEPALLDRLLDPLESYYHLRARHHELLDSFGQAVAALQSPAAQQTPQTTRLVGRLLSSQGYSHGLIGQLTQALELERRSVEILRSTASASLLARALRLLADDCYRTGELRQAATHYQEALALARSSGERRLMGRTLDGLANVLSALGDHAAAQERFQESLMIDRELGDRRSESMTLNNMGFSLSLAGQQEQARRRLLESVAIAREIGAVRETAIALDSLGTVLYELGEYDEAERALNESLRLSRELQDSYNTTSALLDLAFVTMAQERHAEAERQLQEALATAMHSGAVSLGIAALVALAQLRAHMGDGVGAVELLVYALQHQAAQDADKRRAERLLEELRDGLGAEAVAGALARGREKPFTAVVEEILGIKLVSRMAELFQAPEFEVQIDTAKKERQVEEIVESDFFAQLRQKATALRQRVAPQVTGEE